MTSLDELGNRHRQLQRDLDGLREELADAIRAERAATGATFVDLMNRSGYRSIETVRQILDPAARRKVYSARKRDRAARQDQPK